ncbi:hypothetical protein B0A48_17316 [Cryoendolithus antarcticus]|uniref:Uncharacterized protein n=1 Tax=Cryoendolithus antarcticus TaxID=1507870 RepID=A0A1V8SBZ9_9PEZI|nr:hypothetical protein B0A48_17316 [Cryoendolithus antarcticus]
MANPTTANATTDTRVLATASEGFRRGVTGRWAAAKTLWLRHPITKNVVQMKVLALYVVDDTFVLEGMKFDPQSSQTALPFQLSELAQDGWPVPGARLIALASARLLYRTFLGNLYGASLQFPPPKGDRLSRLSSITSSDQALSQNGPTVFLSLALPYATRCLGDSEAMYDAVRHMVAQAPRLGSTRDETEAPEAWHTIAEILDETDISKLQQRMEKQRKHTYDKSQALEKEFLALQEVLHPRRMRSYDPTHSAVDRVAKLVVEARLLTDNFTLSDDNLLLTLDGDVEAPSKHHHYISALTHLDDLPIFCTSLRNLIHSIVELVDGRF